MFSHVVHLVPNSGLHFVEVELPRTAVEATGRTFLRERIVLGGQSIWALKPAEDGRPLGTPSSEPLRIDGATALKSAFDQWLPLPLLRYMARDELGGLQFDEGPHNWARLFIASAEAGGVSSVDGDVAYRAIIGIDTELAANSRLDPGQYACPTLEDVRFSSLFSLSDKPEDLAGFLAEPWVQSWLDEALGPMARPSGRNFAGLGGSLEPIALYLTLLTVLKQAAVVPSMRFLASRAESVAPRPVDLVIDVGAERTTCVLVDRDGASGRIDMESARLLPIRDFSEPGRAHRGAINSTVAFARAAFGDESRSRRSGRSNAFHWPSLVRVGPEASRLVAQTSDGMTGIVSPSRFLADDLVSSDSWRFAQLPNSRASRRQMVIGRMLSHTTGQGLLPAPGPASATPIVRPQFSLSAMSSFYFAELVLQALCAINTPVAAGEGGIGEGRRALNRVVLCLPSDMAVEAQEQAHQRAEAAVAMLWRSLDWQNPDAPFSFEVPTVSRGLDATLGVQLTYLFDEVMQRFGGDAGAYLEAVGRHRPEIGRRPSLRVGAVDIGATGTRLTIATYSIERDQPLRPSVLNLVRHDAGGDELVTAVLTRVVVPALERALSRSGVAEVTALIAPFIAAASGDPHGRLDDVHSRFAAHWLRPAAAGLLGVDIGEGVVPARDLVLTLDQVLANRESIDWTTATAFEAAAKAAGAVDFTLGSVAIATTTRELSDTIAETMRAMVEAISAAVMASDCDLVLLTGWPGRLASIARLFRERMLWRPDRVVELSAHHWQSWYPLSDADRTLCDGKDVALVGAILARAGGQDFVAAEPDGTDGSGDPVEPSSAERATPRRSDEVRS